MLFILSHVFSDVLFVFVEFVTVMCLFCFSDILFQNVVACPRNLSV